jgi:hypothetical protein
LERIDSAESNDETSPNRPAKIRLAAGFAILAALVYIAVRMIPPYFDNMRFQEQMQQSVARSVSPGTVRADLRDSAARLGIPLQDGDIRIEPVAGGLKADVLYIRRIDLGLYAVDLHFHPSASR